MEYDALIFDIDGTLWSAAATSTKAWNAGLASLGIDREVTTADIARVSGMPFSKCVELLYPDLVDNQPQLHETLNSFELEFINEEGGQFFEGVIKGLQKLAKYYPIYLVSNCQEWYLKSFLKFSGIEGLFAGMDCHGLSGVPKDKMFARLQRAHGFQNPVYIGDTQGDLDASRKAGIDFILMDYGFGQADGADREFRSFPELVAWLLDNKAQ